MTLAGRARRARPSAAPAPLAAGVAALDWAEVCAQLDAHGYAAIGPLLKGVQLHTECARDHVHCPVVVVEHLAGDAQAKAGRGNSRSCRTGKLG